VKAVLFDLDGTLLDTLDDLAAAVNRALISLGCPAHSVEAYRTFVGDGAATLIRRALPKDAAPSLHSRALAAFVEDYREHMIVETAPYPGVPELLDALSSLGTPMAVVSNKPDAMTQTLRDELLGSWSFGFVAGQREGAPKKPDPEIALQAARALGAEPSQCFFVGDSDVDITTGRRAGMIAVGVSWGFRGAKELEAAGAASVIDHPQELLDLLE
jgi:phosphoglycolate phosphatase